MIFWTVHIILISAVFLTITGIPLRASDYGQNGHIVHYHRDDASGGHRRHIHYRSSQDGSQPSSFRNTFFQNHGTPVNPAAVYEVPSHRHFNDAMAGRLAVELRSLVDRTNSEYNNSTDVKSENGDNGDSNGKHDNNNGKHENNHEHTLHSLQNRDAPTPPSEAIPNGNVHFPIEALPHGLQFLNRQSQERSQSNAIPKQSNEINLDLQTLLGDMADTSTVPSVTNSDTFLSTNKALDLDFLLGGLGSSANNNQGHDMSHHGHSNNHEHGHQDHVHQGHDHAHSNDHGHQVHDHAQGHGHEGNEHGINMAFESNSGSHGNSINDKLHGSKGARRLGNLFNGMFNQHSSHAPQGHGGHSHGDHGHGHGNHHHGNNMHHEVNTVPTTSPGPPGIRYRQSTLHARPITKRGVADSESISRFSKTFIDNILNIRIGSTVPPHSIVQTTQPTRYRGFLTTPRSVETQIKRLSGVHQNTIKQTNNETPQHMHNKQESKGPDIVSPSPKELVHLQGIHIMFSDGKQDTSRTIPTVHLTASISENVNHLLNMASGMPSTPTQSSSVSSITDKITGTAVIRDGHLYLVVYPFGSNKSLELHYNQSTKRMAMPHNKPVSFTKTKAPGLKTEHVTPSVSIKSASLNHPASHSALVQPTAETKVTSTGHSEHVSTGSSHVHSSSHSHSHVINSDISTKSAKEKSTHAHGPHQHHHGHLHHQHSGSTPSLTGLKLSEVNDTTLQTLLSPIDRFISPWESLNFSKVFPYSAGIPSNATTTKETPKKQLDDDSEVDVVTFIAKAADPFDQMKVIIGSLVNKTLSNTSNIPSSKHQNGTMPEARFNFELKLQPSSSKTDIKSSTYPNNSEEKSFDTNHKTSTFSKAAESKATTESINPESFKPFNKVTSESVGKSSGERGPSSVNEFKSNAQSNYQTTTEMNLVNDILSGTHLTDINKNRNIGGRSTVSPNQMQTTGIDSKFDRFLHVSENIAPSTLKMDRRPSDFFGTTMSYIPNYTESPTTKRLGYQVSTPLSQRIFPDMRNTISRNLQSGPNRNTILGSNLQPFVQRTSPNRFRQGLNRGQSEQIISLADILNDIRRIQLHNMQRFNIQNNNFDTMILSEAQQKPVMRTPLFMEGPVIRETSTRRYSDFPAFMNNGKQQTKQRSNGMPQNSSPVVQRRVNRNAPYESGMEAMLVLSVDDIMNDQTDLHGAIVFSHRRNPSLSKNI
ncbi:filaggrin-2-like [Ruditapes philippinarum]|uniref:filaggrin-2-like n=1 Tax=Ruditapes philippinarum TaxID=129788 RepID=UPI00295BF502|nr:filaggrin-2-like [Ruditapes philippinarum]